VDENIGCFDMCSDTGRKLQIISFDSPRIHTMSRPKIQKHISQSHTFTFHFIAFST